MRARSSRPAAWIAGASLIVLAQGCTTDGHWARRAEPDAKADVADEVQPDVNVNRYFKPHDSWSTGSVEIEGNSVDYDAVAGTILVHAKGWDDAAAKPSDESGPKADDKSQAAEASMFYVAYFQDGAPSRSRPITFVYNGGPGSSSIWLHMGAFGPRRVVTADDTHTPAAPYRVVDNAYSLLDASDLVFIDAPGTGFSRVAGKDKEKAFYGTDADAHAFSEFVLKFLTKYGRWNSPKYLFGESYGTPRSAALINILETKDNVDFNGVILLSQILSYDLATGRAGLNPSVDLPYEMALPTYAATAWYHHKLPDNSLPLEALLEKVEDFALTDYAQALEQGSELSDAERDAVAGRLHDFTGLPVDYIEKADLRIDGGEFEKTLESSEDMTTGRLDTRFLGPTLDPLSESAEYDPQSAAIASAYVSAFNAYVRADLHYGEDETYEPELPLYKTWDYRHTPPGLESPVPQALNVMPDLANAMKENTNLKICLNGGYFDLATPFFEGIYEMRHLPIPEQLQSNIEYHYYESGHMVYAHEESLKALHDTVAGFIARTDNVTRD